MWRVLCRSSIINRNSFLAHVNPPRTSSVSFLSYCSSSTLTALNSSRFQPAARIQVQTFATTYNMEDDSIAANLVKTQKLVKAATDVAKEKGTFICEPRLVAVSKTKPVEAILEAYAAGQRHFGENYVQELVAKANDPKLPKDIQWHFIGTLQSNKAKLVAGIPTIALIETITSIKLASTIEKFLANNDVRSNPIKVFVQINTSGEENKGGVQAGDEAVAVANHIIDSCPHLTFAGVMTIGQYGRITKPGESNPDFIQLIKCRDELCASLKRDKSSIEVSMGMSGDFEHAIELGASSVRVGSALFGAREYKN